MYQRNATDAKKLPTPYAMSEVWMVIAMSQICRYPRAFR